MKQFYLIPLILFLLYGSVLNAAEPYSIHELEKMALENNPQIKSVFNEWKAMVEYITVAKSLPDPNIKYTEFIEEIQTRTGPQQRKISFSQMFPWFGTLRLRRSVANSKAEMIEQKVQNIRLKIINELSITLYDLILLEHKVKIYNNHLGLLDNLEKSAKGRVKSSKGHLSNVLKVQVEKERLKDSLDTYKSFRFPLIKKLEKIIGTKLTRPLPTESTPSLMKLDKKHLTNIFKSNNPKWIGNKKAKEMGEHNIALAKKKGKPNFGVGLGWMETDKSLMPNTRGSGDDPIALTLSLSIPLWRGKVKSQINSEKHKYKSVKEMGESILDNFESDLEIVLFRINDSKRKNELYLNDLLPKVKDAYKSTMTAYEAGKVSFQNLLDAERLVLRISLDYEISKTNHLKSYSNLKKLVGEIR